MQRPSIAIVGCGFIGSHLAEEIAKLLYSQDLFPYNLIFIDYDNNRSMNTFSITRIMKKRVLL